MTRQTDISAEIFFKTARSGGKGGQHVNKVETMVEGYFDIMQSRLLENVQKELLREKLQNRITAEGLLQVKSQSGRSQLANKKQVIAKMNSLINQALAIRKKRIPTRPTTASREKRLSIKKLVAEKKEQRRKGY